ncbi:hypothetical protein SCP_0506690 [Sparassis crispa]|uniref:Uncharacterized protein n=1 Tax=Sparassis crispa TaxID=139825 RepID=A0A401GPC8_9APHY|nr:hypothetical protein SCP_0506690 [Sparassis crispa]GBE83614.1 hypothetical protein SCP_0506690 [Sparassis crispa]
MEVAADPDLSREFIQLLNKELQETRFKLQVAEEKSDSLIKESQGIKRALFERDNHIRDQTQQLFNLRQQYEARGAELAVSQQAVDALRHNEQMLKKVDIGQSKNVRDQELAIELQKNGALIGEQQERISKLQEQLRLLEETTQQIRRGHPRIGSRDGFPRAHASSTDDDRRARQHSLCESGSVVTTSAEQHGRLEEMAQLKKQLEDLKAQIDGPQKFSTFVQVFLPSLPGPLPRRHEIVSSIIGVDSVEAYWKNSRYPRDWILHHLPGEHCPMEFSRLSWRGPHAFVVSPTHIYSLASGRKRGRSWNQNDEFTRLIGCRREIFYTTDDTTFYAGTYQFLEGPRDLQVSDLVNVEEWPLDQEKLISMFGFTNAAALSPSAIQSLLCNLYQQGIAKVNIFCLQNIGFNEEYYRAMKDEENRAKWDLQNTENTISAVRPAMLSQSRKRNRGAEDEANDSTDDDSDGDTIRDADYGTDGRTGGGTDGDDDPNLPSSVVVNHRKKVKKARLPCDRHAKNSDHDV